MESQHDCALQGFLSKKIQGTEQSGPSEWSQASTHAGRSGQKAAGWTFVPRRFWMGLASFSSIACCSGPTLSLLARNEFFPLQSFVLWCLGQYPSPGPNMLSLISVWSTPAYPQPLCEPSPSLGSLPDCMEGPTSGFSRTPV